MRSRSTFLASALPLFFSACPLLAADYTWLGGNGLYTDSALWSPTGVPGSGDNARLNASAPGTVTWTGPATNASLVASAIGGNTLVLNLAGNAYTLTNRFYFDGDKANTFVAVSNGVFTVPANVCDVKINAGVAPARMVFAAGATASISNLNTWRSSVNVETGAALTCSGEVKIGDNATSGAYSELNANGGSLTLTNNLWINGGNNSTSVLNIAGGVVTATKYFSIGNGGAGTAWGFFNLSGGVLDTAGNVWIANAGSTRGAATITGGVWTNRVDLEVAHGGSTIGWFNMSGGEIVMPVSGRNLIVANSGNGHMTTGTVSITGGQLTATNGIAVMIGNATNSLGQFYLGGSGVVLVRDFKMATYKAARGEAVVTGGVLRAVNYVSVGAAIGGDGYMRVEGGDLNAGLYRVAEYAGSTGLFVLANGNVRSDTYFYVGSAGNGSLVMTGGSLLITNEYSLGLSAGAFGKVQQSGGTVTTTNNVKVGDWGGTGLYEMSGGTNICRTGTFLVANGNGSTGTLTMTGGRILACNNFTIANNGTKGSWGSATVSGGDVVVSNSVTLGSSSNCWGTLAMSGGTLEAGYISLGNLGVGNFAQSNGTVLSRGNLALGSTASGTGTLSVAGGETTIRGNVQVSSYGYGSLAVSGGTLAISNTLSFGQYTNSTAFGSFAGGTVLVKGTGSHDWGAKGVTQIAISGGTNLFAGTVNIGVSTQATVVISGGSNVFSGANLCVARNNAGSSATLTVSGGKTYVPNGYLDVGQFGQGVLEVSGGELTTAFLRMNPGSTVSPVPPQSEIRVSGGRLSVTNACYMPDTTSITGRLTLTGGELVVPVLRQHWGKLNVLFDGGEVEAYKVEPDFIRELDVHALTANGLLVDSAGFAIGTALALPDAAGQHGRLVKRGLGTFTLNAATTFTGPLVVQGGELALGASGLVTLTGGCTVNGGALLNLSARSLDFTLPSGTSSRIDGELRLASAKTLTVAGGAALAGTGVVGRVVLTSGATFARSASDGAALLHASELVIPAGAVIALSGYTLDDLLQGIPVATAGALTAARRNLVTVTLDGAAQPYVALRTSGGILRLASYEPGTLLTVE